jgi:hypothetical protein
MPQILWGALCVGEGLKPIDGPLSWRTPVNLKAGETYKTDWQGRVTDEHPDCSQAIEFGLYSMIIAQKADS